MFECSTCVTLAIDDLTYKLSLSIITVVSMIANNDSNPTFGPT